MQKRQVTQCLGRHLTLRPLLFLFVFLIVVFQSRGQNEAYNWKSVAIGGGGFVSGIITSKTQSGLIYARTDVGGAYRWDGTNSRWIPLLDWVSDDEVGYLGVESIAIDPTTPSKVYMLVGISYFNNGKTAILRSNDYGNTFSITEVTSQFKAHGNGMGRQNGEKLIVDPNNSNILYCGTRWNGIFKSTNGGVNWSRLSGLDVTTTPNENGVSFVVADGSSVSGGATQRVFAGISRTGSNFYRSDNGGQTFTAVSGGPTSLMPQRAVLASDGNLYITYANGAGPSGHWSLPEPSDTGQIWKYNVATGSWTNVTPSGVSYAFGGISVDPGNPNRLIASTINTWTSQGGAWGDRFYLSTNGGSSWTDVVSRGFSMDPNGITWISGKAIHWTGSIEFDPFNTQKVFVTSGNGIFVNENINATAGVWKFLVAGLEETVPLGIASIPNGPVVSVIGDYDGFVHSNPSQYAPIHSPSMGTTTGLALGGNKLLRAGNSMYYSTNQGTSWTQCTMNGTKGQVAISSDGNTFLHCPESSSTTYRSTNNGSSWSTVSGLSIGDARPVADPVNANKFYVYNPSNGAMLVSTNGGSGFSSSGSTASGGSKLIRVAPGREGHVWVALNGGGLARSTNSGQTFSTVSGVTACGAIGFGKEASGASYPALYIWGTVNGVRGVHRSTNEGASWVRVNDNDHEYGGPGNGQFVQGDMNVFGRVFMSTAGRGIVFGDPAACTPTAITPYVQINGGSWQQTATASVAQGGSVKFGPQPVSGGSWSWSGPNNFSGTTREVTISNVQNAQAGNYVATYTNTNGCNSTQSFGLTVTGTNIIVRARGTQGSETIELRVNNSVVGTWTLTTAYQNHSASGSGTVSVHFTNDNSGRDVQIDYVTIAGATYQAENQSTNTGVWQNNTCGGSNSEWLNCNGYISFTTSSGAGARMAIDEGLVMEEKPDQMITYPNPVTDLLTLTFPTEMDSPMIAIINASGNTILREKASGASHTLDIALLPAGFYIVRASQGIKNHVVKIIKR